ncbi:uncharacterized protein LOC130711239 [Lotus japonicus]|uniref:uncharacterized protein LOC130711239 n=1 Tax=Lotus japonicus TaxID=34305 RepID=UPI0025904488|nr:uncharacterized protein LOC130711239 [Lotus japonicus]
MSRNKRKEHVDTPTTDKSKAEWDVRALEIYIKLCLDQVYKGERSGTTLTKNGWIVVKTEFNKATNRNYEKIQFRNKWDNLRKEWLAWDKLFSKETGLGWDEEKKTLAAPDEWWEKKIMENKQYAKYRYKGLAYANELTILFKDVVATGKHAWAPSSRVLPNEEGESADGYRPTFESGCINLDEGSGDSDEIGGAGEGASVGVSAEFGNINLSNGYGNSSDKSGGKRKRIENAEKASNKKMVNVPASKKIADAISRIATASESRSTTVNKLVVPGVRSSFDLVVQLYVLMITS